MRWEVVIGLETHAQLSTASKIFSGASTAFGAAPNTQASVIDLALPGVLPVLNKGAVERAIRFGLAVGATVAPKSIFARKNYFYPDLPKGYQISQYEIPVVQGGSVTIVVTPKGGEPYTKTVRLTRAHLEEDAGKSLHEGEHLASDQSGIDLNRAGTPLLEIVSEPEMRSSAEAVAYAKTLHSLVTWLGICDGNMQEGSFRCDANVSVRPVGTEKFGTRVEIKNLNSFRFLQQAIDHEVRRQIELIEDGGKVVQETRLYDPDRDETRSMRSKEDAMDYRYFPDPDLLPLAVSAEWIERVRREMPELPHQRRYRYFAKDAQDFLKKLREQDEIDDSADWDVWVRQSYGEALAKVFRKTYDLRPDEADYLASNRAIGDYFESTVEALGSLKPLQQLTEEWVPVAVKTAANWVMGEVAARSNSEDRTIEDCLVTPQHLAELISRVLDGTINNKTAKDVFAALWNKEGSSADQIIEARGLKQISDGGAIEALIDEVLAANPGPVAEFCAGKDKAFNSLVGQAMKATKGKANPQQVNEILRRKLAG